LKKKYKIFIDARTLEREANADTFNLDGLRYHYNISLTEALEIKRLLDKDKQLR
tara:strand:+ start:564 stop:725 length:162 start_codon:yes stop_codon:yes gene_type:complete